MNAVTPENILKVGMGFWASKTLLSAVELGVFTTLAQGPADLHPRSGADFLDSR